MRKIMQRQPEKWQGRYLLKCTHAFNSVSEIRYVDAGKVVAAKAYGVEKLKEQQK